MSQEQANQELHARTIEVLKKLSKSMEPVAWMYHLENPAAVGPVTTCNSEEAKLFDWQHSPQPLHATSITQDELALLCHLCGINEKDIK